MSSGRREIIGELPQSHDPEVYKLPPIPDWAVQAVPAEDPREASPILYSKALADLSIRQSLIIIGVTMRIPKDEYGTSRTATYDLTGLDQEMLDTALEGAEKIRAHTDLPKEIRRPVVDFLKTAKGPVTEEHVIEIGLIEDNPDPSGKSPREARVKAQAEHEEHRDEVAEVLFNMIAAAHTDIDITDYQSLYDRLGGRIRGNGEINVRPRKGFYNLLNGLTHELLLDPERMVSLVASNSIIPGVNRLTIEGKPLMPYLDTLKEEITTALSHAELDVRSIPSEILSRWFELMDEAPLELVYDMIDQKDISEEELSRISNRQLSVSGVSIHFLEAVLNDFIKTTDQYSPVDLVDKVHLFMGNAFGCDAGNELPDGLLRYQPDPSTRMNRALDTLKTTFDQRPLAIMIFANGPGSKLPIDSRVKLLDIRMLLQKIGEQPLLKSPSTRATGPFDFDLKSRRLLGKIFPFKTERYKGEILAATDPDGFTAFMEETKQELAIRLSSPETRDTTLIGRLTSITPEDVRNQTMYLI